LTNEYDHYECPVCGWWVTIYGGHSGHSELLAVGPLGDLYFCPKCTQKVLSKLGVPVLTRKEIDD